MNAQILVKINEFVKNRLIEFIGVVLIIFGIFLLISILSYTPSDPTFIYKPETSEIKNFGGFYGSVVADFLLQSIGILSFFVILNFLNWGFTLISNKKINNLISKVFFTITYVIFGTTFVNVLFNNSFWLIDNGNSGFVGRIIRENSYIFTNILENQYFILFLLILAVIFFVLSLNLKIKGISKIFTLPYFLVKKLINIFFDRSSIFK